MGVGTSLRLAKASRVKQVNLESLSLTGPFQSTTCYVCWQSPFSIQSGHSEGRTLKFVDREWNVEFDPRQHVSLPLRDIAQRNKTDRSQGFAEATNLLRGLLERGLDEGDAEFVYGELAFVHYFYGQCQYCPGKIAPHTPKRLMANA